MPILSIFLASSCACGTMITRHPTYQGFEALVEILSGEVTEGRLPKKAAAIVKEWCLRHQAELLANWEHAQHFEPMERIPGADQDD